MEETREIFDYFEESDRKKLKMKIGNFISHEMNWLSDDGSLLAVDQVNNLERVKLAEKFIKSFTNDKIDCFNIIYNVTREYEEFELVNDIAQFIDLKIPKNYWIRLMEEKMGRIDRSSVARQYKGIDSVYGLEFWFEDNYLLEFHW